MVSAGGPICSIVRNGPVRGVRDQHTDIGHKTNGKLRIEMVCSLVEERRQLRLICSIRQEEMAEA